MEESRKGTTTPPAVTQIWDKVIGGWLGEKISFIVVVSAVALCLILLLALIITCFERHSKKGSFEENAKTKWNPPLKNPGSATGTMLP
ncbi:hypothetical protein AC249_AIPGENE14516 [Exaiptasia diaphana]|nr:hypothetical protein AC249_AIPGENE14516 [Exaiptasia diaphana]